MSLCRPAGKPPFLGTRHARAVYDRNSDRLTTRGGLVGVAGAVSYADHGYESSVAETLRSMIATLIGRSPLDREAIWHQMSSKSLVRAPQAQSIVDIALWDLAAKAADMPLWQMLGGARSRIAAYASTPLYESAQAYVDAVSRFRGGIYRGSPTAGASQDAISLWCVTSPIAVRQME